MNPPRLLRTVLAWPVETQQGARRNALAASTVLTGRRQEREDVEDFLATRFVQAVHRRPPGSGSSRVSQRRQHVI